MMIGHSSKKQRHCMVYKDIAWFIKYEEDLT